MPSGITSDIYEDKDVSLHDYLMRVGRQMGFASAQRDDDPNAPVRYREPSTSYYDKSQAEAEARLAELAAMTDAEIAAAARQAFEDAHAEWERTKAKKAALRARYEAMLREVEAWKPEPLIASTKDEAIRYLRESIEFDCSRDGSDLRYYPEPVEKAPDVWLAEERASAHRAITYAEEQRAEELERVADFNRYIAAFYASLPPAPETALTSKESR